MSNWVVKKIDEIKINKINEIAKKYSISTFLAKILVNRNIDIDEVKYMLSENINDIIDEKLLSDIDVAAKKINKYVVENKKIRIVGDYDVDGISATYILYDGLKNIGADVSFRIPERIKDGYGINISIIEECIKDKIDLIITCDNGISQKNEIEYAIENNIDVIITDHHEIPNDPIKNVITINPKRKDVENVYPFDSICGAVVAYKVIIYLYKFLKKDEDIINKYLPFATIATICDIMPLINENHIITKIGLANIKDTSNKGLKKLIEISGLYDKTISYYHIGFIIGPLINATGRIESATTAIKLFTSNDDNEIIDLANRLKNLNDERKNMTIKGAEEAIKEVDDKYTNDKVLVLFLNDVKEQVAGIVAGRIKDKYNKPTIVLTNSNEEGVLKASCRSIEAYDIFENLERHKDLFLKFGGHKLAAGFSMKKENLDILRKYLNEETVLTDKDLVKTIYADDILNINSMSIMMYDEINKISPYGNQFEKPCYIIKDAHISIKNIYGEKQNIGKISVFKNNIYLNAITFDLNDKMKELIDNNDVFNVLFSINVNEYNSNRKLELNIIDIKKA